MKTDQNSNNTRQHILVIAQKVIESKGFAAVGLNEILKAAEVPKGSFYYYFASKEAFGVAMLEEYFKQYLIKIVTVLTRPNFSAKENLMEYWGDWLKSEEESDQCIPCGQKCLVVKLGAEVSDLSDSMRLVLKNGTHNITKQLSIAIETMIEEEKGFEHPFDNAYQLAKMLYQMWLGASLVAKINQSDEPLENAMIMTKQLLNL